jgi:AAA family ATP:ADP antiporter
VFFVWLSVFNLFVVSVFWSFMADIFDREQAKRLYGFIAAGASAGGILGPLAAATLVPAIGSINLLPLAAALLGLAMLFMRFLMTWHRRQDPPARAGTLADVDRPVGGSAWASVPLVLRSPYLLAIAGLVFLLTWVSTFLYLQQAELVSKAFASPEQQTQVFAWIDFAVQALSMLTQLFAVGHLTMRFGLTPVLLSVPVLMVTGFATLALLPALPVLIAVMVVRRVGQYAITRPCREMLFTVVDRETKYKAKNLIDTVIYRGGDAVSGSLHSGLVAFGLATAGVALAGTGVAALAAVLALFLGRSFNRAPATVRRPVREGAA